jgi:hypothetical protein
VVKPKFFARRIKKASELLPKAKIKEISKNSFTLGFKNFQEKLNFCEVFVDGPTSFFSETKRIKRGIL